MTSMQSESTFITFDENGVCIPAGPVGQLKEQLATFLANPRVEVAVAGIVLLNSLLVAISTVPSIAPETFQVIRLVENALGIVLLAEFLARWFSSNLVDSKFILNARFFIDIVAVILPLVFSLTPQEIWIQSPLPNWVTSPSGLFNLKLLRVFRFQRVLQDRQTFSNFERALGIPLVDDVKEWQLQLARVLLSLFTLLSVSTGLVYTAEHEVNPEIPDYFTALYFGLTALTTVGFGDITPVTFGGRLVVCGSIIAGVAIVPVQAAALAEALFAREEGRRPRRKRLPRDKKSMNSFSTRELDTSLTCDSCGAQFHWSDARFCYYCGENL